MRGPPRREKREEGRAEQRSHPEPPAKGAETRNDAMSTQSAWSPGGSLRTRRLLSIRETPCSFYHSLNDLQANHADISEGYERNALFRNFRAGLCACQESGKNAKTERRSITPSPPRARHGAAALREAPAERDLSMIMRRNIPRTARLNTLFPVPVRIPMTKPRKGTAPQANGSVPQCSILRAPKRARLALAKGRERESRDALRNREAPALGRLSAPCRCLPRERCGQEPGIQRPPVKNRTKSGARQRAEYP